MAEEVESVGRPFTWLNPFLEDDEITGSEAPPAEADQVRHAFRRACSSVAVITAAGPDGPVGFTASSLTTVTLDPPTLSFAISRIGSSWEGIRRSGHFGVHLLGADEAALARRFATPDVDRFASPVRWSVGPFGVPLLDHGSAALVASVWRRLVIGDHDLVLARILQAMTRVEGASPLAYHDGRYGTFTGITA